MKYKTKKIAKNVSLNAIVTVKQPLEELKLKLQDLIKKDATAVKVCVKREEYMNALHCHLEKQSMEYVLNVVIPFIESGAKNV